MAFETLDQLSGLYVPNANDGVEGTSGDESAIRGDAYGGHSSIDIVRFGDAD